MNILLQDRFDTPFETVPFSKISLQDFEEAIMEGMRLEDEAIKAITENAEKPTFANTILPKTDEVLSRATTVFFNLLSANTTDEMDELAQKLSPLLTEHSNRILLNAKLFARIKHVHDNATGLSPEEERLLKDVYEGFVRNGACLPEEEKKRLSEMNVELSGLTLSFNQNHLKETNAYSLHITDAEKLKGLPETAMEAAYQEAKEKGLEGWLFTLHQPSFMPFMRYAEDRELRKEMFLARERQCCQGNEYDNREIVKRIVNLRREIAQILGFKTYADYVLTHRMAERKENVFNLIDQLLDAYGPVAKDEVKEIEEMARKMEGDDFCLQPWDFAFYSQKLKMQRYNLDAEMLRPYFQLEKVKDGIFGLATKLYGITFRRNNEIDVFHPDVEAYEVHDENGELLAILYADFFPRASKQSGAWMTSFSEQYVDEKGVDHRPHVSITANLTKPTPQKPSLLTLGEVETFLHEFGHALHGMFSKCRFQSLSGTNVYWDFVELPSQFMENYAVEPEFLNTFAFHYETGEPIPEDLIARIRKSRNFLCGYACLRQLSFCMLDMAYYTMEEPFAEDVMAFEKNAWKRAQLLPEPEGCCMTVQFGHIMSGGYSAGYYSYKWAEVLDADAFHAFKEEGIFNKEVASRFRNEVLSKGGTRPPMELYINFRGKKPTIDALLERNGIKKEANR